MTTTRQLRDVPIDTGATGTRIESDSMGSIEVPAEHYWGAQTQKEYSTKNPRFWPFALVRRLGRDLEPSKRGDRAQGSDLNECLYPLRVR